MRRRRPPHLFEPLLGHPDCSYGLVNQSRGVVLAARIETAFDSQSRRRGLLGRSDLPRGTVLAIAPSNAVHTFGMRFPIDILFIGRGGLVLKCVRNLRPGRIAAAWGAFAVLEFAAGAAALSATQPGDRLDLNRH
jgi:uncharacterized membrane protein (UPF0127 family)